MHTNINKYIHIYTHTNYMGTYMHSNRKLMMLYPPHEEGAKVIWLKGDIH